MLNPHIVMFAGRRCQALQHMGCRLRVNCYITGTLAHILGPHIVMFAGRRCQALHHMGCRLTVNRLSSGPYFSYYSYFSLLFCCAPTFPYFFVQMPYYPYFFVKIKIYMQKKGENSVFNKALLMLERNFSFRMSVLN